MTRAIVKCFHLCAATHLAPACTNMQFIHRHLKGRHLFNDYIVINICAISITQQHIQMPISVNQPDRKNHVWRWGTREPGSQPVNFGWVCRLSDSVY